MDKSISYVISYDAEHFSQIMIEWMTKTTHLHMHAIILRTGILSWLQYINASLHWVDKIRRKGATA